jgi:hypothetical protein
MMYANSCNKQFLTVHWALEQASNCLLDVLPVLATAQVSMSHAKSGRTTTFKRHSAGGMRAQ